MARGPGKGNTNNPNGRPKGVPNKTTKEMKALINKIVSGHLDKVDETLDQIRESDQDKYLSLLFRFMEFVVAKKNDITSDDEPIKPALNIQVTDPRIGEELKKLLE